ncbi:MAG: CinA family protein [Alphaproteobacteria bacterium]|nr:CinA family protein [Alphaproteobacteria bacterium]
MTGEALTTRVERLLERCKERGWMLATAESCTGGMIAAALTDIAGSSAVVDRGFITYSNQAKQELLDVPEALLAEHGAVSGPVAEAMALGALRHSRADLAVSATGIAGPGGATPAKPVGLVFIGAARRGGQSTHRRCQFGGDRAAVREASVEAAVELIARFLDQP